MKINEVERLTGLTQKAIRLYETRGLLTIARDANGYRNYTETDVKRLRELRLLRSAGVGIPDIRLYADGVVTVAELIEKRKQEILKESGRSSDQYRLCEQLAEPSSFEEERDSLPFYEAEELTGDEIETTGAFAVGIDIGTTTVSAAVWDLNRKEQVEAYTLPHRAYLASDVFSEQDATGILDKTKRLLDHLLRRYRGIVSIGLSGQMHGIVYYDREGAPVSPLINWQDKRADRRLENGETVCETILRMTGERIATGYGLATHYYNVKKGLVPPEAVGFGSIMDLFGMKICGLKRAVTHTSVAASFGLFDVKAGTFRTEALAALGIDPSLLPRVTSESAVIGVCEGIPVAVALGDNQASVLGSVKHNTDSLLVNIGTGSQISVVTACGEACGDMELRPFVEGEYLLCGSALSGGFAYAMLERFFQSYAIRAGLPEMAQYTLMNELAAEAYENGEPGLTVDVSFCGKRHDPHCRGKIEGIGRENFTPSALVLGVLKGMCHELWELSATLPEKKSHVVASGGAVRRNETLRRLIGDRFGTAVSVVAVEEEAATGAALFSAFCVGRISYCDGFSEYIRYE